MNVEVDFRSHIPIYLQILSQIKEKVLNSLRLVGLEGLHDRYATLLSGGGNVLSWRA